MYVNKPMSELFGMTGEAGKALLPYFEGERESVPEINPNYRFDPIVLRLIMMWYFQGDDVGMRNLALYGHFGAGKTEAINQFAARLNISVYEDIGDDGRTYQDFLGLYLPGPNGIEFQESMLLQSMKSPYAIYLMNEGDRLPPKTWVELHNLLDKGIVRNPANGDTHEAATGWRLAITANTNGCGDPTGLYIGTRPFNRATVSRFSWVPVSYLSKKDEVNVVIASGMTDPIMAEHLVNFARLTRTMAISGQGVKSMLSTRQLVNIAKLSGPCFKSDVLEKKITPALEVCFFSSISPSDRSKFVETYKDVFGFPYESVVGHNDL